MMIKEYSTAQKEPKTLISQEEILNLIEDKMSIQFISTILRNIQKSKIDEQTFGFLFRKLHPFIRKLFTISKISGLVDLDKLNLLTKIINCIDFTYDIFLTYFSDEYIVKMYEILTICDEKVREPIRRLLEVIFTKFEKSSELFKEIIANRLLVILPFDDYSLEFNFRILLMMLSRESFGENPAEYYSQYILPQILYCSLDNIELARNVVDAVCSITTSCQRTTLRYFLKVYPNVGSNEQIKILELVSRVIHTNFFYQSRGFLEWEFCEIINLATQSESYIVVDLVIEMISDSAVKRFIQKNLKVILPKIFDNMYRLSKKFWKQEQRLKAIGAIGSILSIDSEVFEICLIEYNKRKHMKKIKETVKTVKYDISISSDICDATENDTNGAICDKAISSPDSTFI